MTQAPEIHVARDGDTLVPVSEFDAAMIRRHPHGKVLAVDIREPRSVGLNRLYWSVLRGVNEGKGLWASVKALHEDLKENLGYKDVSTAFKAMSEEEFRVYTRMAFLMIQEVILPGYTIEEIIILGKGTLSQAEQEALDAMQV